MAYGHCMYCEYCRKGHEQAAVWLRGNHASIVDAGTFSCRRYPPTVQFDHWKQPEFPRLTADIIEQTGCGEFVLAEKARRLQIGALSEAR